MATFKINISTKDGKTYHVESDSESFIGKSIKEKVDGNDFNDGLNGYVFEITGASDKAGLPALDSVEGVGLKGLLLSYGTGMKTARPKGLRKRKTIRGKVISENIVQINLKLVKAGGKKLEEVFSDQNKAKEEPKAVEAAPVA